MKKMFMILAAVLLTASVFLPGQLVNAQSPNKMSYQAVVRDLTNHLVTSHSVGMRVSILQGVIPVYIETHAVNTNENGLVSIEIGTGTVISGNFATINWANGPYFVKTETDPAGGTSYTITGTSQLLSVPYALHAKTVASYIEIDPKVGLNSTNYLSKWNGTSLVSSSIFDNGNVGIGTTSPGSKLSIVGDMFNTGNILSQGTQDFQGGSILIRNLSGKQITLGQSGTNDYIQTEGGGVLEFNHLGDSPVTWFFNGGNVGIGTATPTTKLDVNGVITATGGNSTNWNIAYSWGNHANAGYLKSFTETDPKIGTNTLGYSPKWNGSALVTGSIYQDALGNVGIGTTQPMAKLDINGSVQIGEYLNVSQGISAANLRINDYGDAQNPAIKVGQQNLDGDWSGFYATPGDHYNILKASVERMNGPYTPLEIHYNKIISNVDVGIGTPTPTTKLDVNGVITATGGNSTNWNIAYSWGNHVGLYRPIGYVPAWSEITNKPSFATVATSGSYNDLSNKPTITHYIGESYGGGKVFYVYDNEQHGLIAATADQSTGVQWYNGTYRCTGTISYGGINAGAMNTAMIVATQISDNQTGFFAAKYCADYQVTVGGVTYGDWYLPSQFELDLLYLERSVVGGFVNAFYWSSSEANSNSAWYRNFFDGSLNFNLKVNTYYVRAIRAF